MKSGRKHFPRFIKNCVFPLLFPLKWLYKQSQRHLMIRNARTNKISDLHNKTSYQQQEEEAPLQETFMVSCVNNRDQEQLPPLLLRPHILRSDVGTPGSSGTTPQRNQQNVSIPMTLLMQSSEDQQSQPGSATKKKKKQSPVSKKKKFFWMNYWAARRMMTLVVVPFIANIIGYQDIPFSVKQYVKNVLVACVSCMYVNSFT